VVPKRYRLIATIFGTGVLLVALSLLAGYLSLRHVPTFYRVAMATPAEERKQLSDAMIRQVTGLSNGLRRDGEWSAKFSEEQINGWLAYDLPENHGHNLPTSLIYPCVRIEGDTITLAGQYTEGMFPLVLRLSFQASISEPNVLALRLLNARAGAMPIPMARILEKLSLLARKMDADLRWSTHDGSPVALLRIEPSGEDSDQQIVVEQVIVGEGHLSVSGHTDEVSSIAEDSTGFQDQVQR